jgi:hypothetical protein
VFVFNEKNSQHSIKRSELLNISIALKRIYIFIRNKKKHKQNDEILILLITKKG